MDKLIGGPAVVDLVKIHAVAEGADPRIEIRLVEQPLVGRVGCGKQGGAVFVQKHQFQKGGLVVLKSQAQLLHTPVYGFSLPGEHISQGDLSQIRPVLGGIGPAFQGENSPVPGGYVVGQGGGGLGAEVQFHRLALGHVVGTLRGLHVSQVIEGKTGVHQSYRSHTEEIRSSQGLLLSGRPGGQGQFFLQSKEHTGLAGILESVPMPENGFAACLSVELPGEKAQENLPCQHSSGDQKDDGGFPVIAGRIIEEQDIAGVVKVQDGKASIAQVGQAGGLVHIGQQQKQQSRVHVALVHAHGQYKNADYQQRGQEGIFFPVPGAAKA